MQWIDLRNPLVEREIGVAAERAQSVDTYECKRIDEQMRLLLLRQDFTSGRETLLFSAPAGASPAAGGYAAGENDWLLAAVWNGADEMEVYGLNAQTGERRWQRHVEQPGQMDWLLPLSPDYFLARYCLLEQDPLYARYIIETGVPRVVFLYGPEGVYLVKDPILAQAEKEKVRLRDSTVIVEEFYMPEAEKERCYQEERSAWISLPQARDRILVASVDAFIQEIISGAFALSFQTAAQAGIDSYVRFTALADGKIYYRAKFFPAAKEKLYAWEIGSGQVENLCDWCQTDLQEGDCLYHTEHQGETVGVCGFYHSQMRAEYPANYGKLQRVLQDRFLVLAHGAPNRLHNLVTLYDTETGEAQTWESQWTAAAGRLILY